MTETKVGLTMLDYCLNHRDALTVDELFLLSQLHGTVKHGPGVNFDQLQSLVRIWEGCYTEVSNEILSALKEDAQRYRFLRDEDRWGEDSGVDCWGRLAESHNNVFDDIVDSRMAKEKSNA